ncbi:MAG: hypothetical protein ACOYBR_00735 [Fluviibacter sp.]
MPLPNMKKQCTAKAKSTGKRCNNPAASNNCCRLHGGAYFKRISGPEHHWFKHGDRSKQGILTQKEIRRRLAYLEEIGYIAGILKGKRTPGRKPT